MWKVGKYNLKSSNQNLSIFNVFNNQQSSYESIFREVKRTDLVFFVKSF